MVYSRRTAFRQGSAGDFAWLHRVREGSEVEILCPNRGHHLTSCRRLGTADVLQLREHEERALVPAEILETARDFSFFDKERSVAREPSEKNCAWIQEPNVEEMRDENSTLGSGD